MKSLKEIIQVLNDCYFSYVNALKRCKERKKKEKSAI